MDHQEQTADVYVVDTPRAAGVALGAARAGAESTHVLCRHADETTADFTRRVLARVARIQRTRRVRALWYVVGESTITRRSSTLLSSLSTLVGEDAHLTVVAPGSQQSELFAWIDSVMQRRASGVTVRAHLYPDAEQREPRVVRAPRLPAHPVRSSGMPPLHLYRWLAGGPALLPDALPASAA
jgi:hypothetical protein